MGWMQRTDLYLKDVTMFRNPSVICLLKEDLVPITQTSGILILNMEAAVDSGMEDANQETTILRMSLVVKMSV